MVAQLRNANLSPDTVRDYYHITVLITTACNLACSYCFQNVAFVSGKPPLRIPSLSLTARRIESIMRFAERRLEETGKNKLDLMLFGGEPMMQVRECATLLTKAGALGMTGADMVSNGTLLTKESTESLAGLGLRSVQITLDGDRPEHDRLRVTRGGRGTFDKIMHNLAAASDVQTVQWTIRVNLTAENFANVPALLSRLKAQLDPSRFDLYFALVRESTIFDDGILPSRTLAERLGEYYRLAIDGGFNVPLPRAPIKCDACGEVGGTAGAVVNSDGTLYSCWESAGKADMVVGHVNTGYLPPRITTTRWKSCGYTATSKPTKNVHDEFKDIVDAAVLEHLYASNKLRAMSDRRLRWAASS